MWVGFGSSKQVVVISDPRRTSSTFYSDPDDFAASDTVRIYCSQSAGNDSNNGLTEGTAKKTIAAAKALIIAGQNSVLNRPDQLLLKRGDTWTDETFGVWTLTEASNGTPIGGRSAAQRFVIGAYGTGVRPRVKYGSLQSPLSMGYLSTSNIAILGIDFDSYQYPAGSGPDNGITWLGGGSYMRANFAA